MILLKPHCTPRQVRTIPSFHHVGIGFKPETIAKISADVDRAIIKLLKELK